MSLPIWAWTILKNCSPEPSLGSYTLFSQERLFGFLNKLDRKVTVKITPRRSGEKPQEVVVA